MTFQDFIDLQGTEKASLVEKIINYPYSHQHAHWLVKNGYAKFDNPEKTHFTTNLVIFLKSSEEKLIEILNQLNSLNRQN